MAEQNFQRPIPHKPIVRFTTPVGVIFVLIPRSDSLLRALQRAGVEQVADLNSPFVPAACTGFTDHIVDRDADRDSTNRAFLSPQLTQQRKARLKICTNALVSRIELAGSEGDIRAVGVHFEASDSRQARLQYFVRVEKEVILCAGAFGSPQILMMRYIPLYNVYPIALTIMQWHWS